MEYAVFVSQVGNLKYCDGNFTRLYYGNEFCQQLIPSQGQLQKVLDFAQKLDFSLVTPYVTDDGLRKLEPLFDQVSRDKPGTEVVFNDWGVFSILKEHYPSLMPVAGRLLNKMKRDPRLMTVLNKIPQQSLEYFRGSNLSVPVYRQFLLENGVKRAEFDNVMQGIDFDFDGLELSLYMPFAYLTTTRDCLVNSCDIPETKDLVGIYPCHRECQKYTFYLESQVMPVPLVRKGNTIFFKNEQLPQGAERISRLVIQPEIPM